VARMYTVQDVNNIFCFSCPACWNLLCTKLCCRPNQMEISPEQTKFTHKFQNNVKINFKTNFFNTKNSPHVVFRRPYLNHN
jgi:hypothetical protein